MRTASPILLDANLGILLAVGLTNPRYIRIHKRLTTYDETDYSILSNLISQSTGLVLVPNVLTEISNLTRYIREPFCTEISYTVASIIQKCKEIYVESKIAANHSQFTKLGLTDVVLLTLAGSGGTLLTADLDLYLAASRANLSSINYNHIRAERLDFR